MTEIRVRAYSLETAMHRAVTQVEAQWKSPDFSYPTGKLVLKACELDLSEVYRYREAQSEPEWVFEHQP